MSSTSSTDPMAEKAISAPYPQVGTLALQQGPPSCLLALGSVCLALLLAVRVSGRSWDWTVADGRSVASQLSDAAAHGCGPLASCDFGRQPYYFAPADAAARFDQRPQAWRLRSFDTACEPRPLLEAFLNGSSGLTGADGGRFSVVFYGDRCAREIRKGDVTQCFPALFARRQGILCSVLIVQSSTPDRRCLCRCSAAPRKTRSSDREPVSCLALQRPHEHGLTSLWHPYLQRGPRHAAGAVQQCRRKGVGGARPGADPAHTLQVRVLVHHRQHRLDTRLRCGCIPGL